MALRNSSALVSTANNDCRQYSNSCMAKSLVMIDEEGRGRDYPQLWYNLFESVTECTGIIVNSLKLPRVWSVPVVRQGAVFGQNAYDKNSALVA